MALVCIELVWMTWDVSLRGVKCAHILCLSRWVALSCWQVRRAKLVRGLVYVWSRWDLYIGLDRLHLSLGMIFHICIVPWTFLMLVQGREHLRLLQVVTTSPMALRTHWPTSREHDRLASCILRRWNALTCWWHLIFEDTAHHRICLVHLVLRNLRLVRATRRN